MYLRLMQHKTDWDRWDAATSAKEVGNRCISCCVLQFRLRKHLFGKIRYIPEAKSVQVPQQNICSLIASIKILYFESHILLMLIYYWCSDSDARNITCTGRTWRRRRCRGGGSSWTWFWWPACLWVGRQCSAPAPGPSGRDTPAAPYLWQCGSCSSGCLSIPSGTHLQGSQPAHRSLADAPATVYFELVAH